MLLQRKENFMKKNLNEISIDDLSYFFSHSALNFLMENQIYSLASFLDLANMPDVLLKLTGKSFYEEITGTYRVLRCKYLNEDPFIDIYDDEKNSVEIFPKLGLSVRSARALKRSYAGRIWGYSGGSKEDWSVKRFFEVMGDPHIDKKLMNIRNLGIVSIQEILHKVQIVLEYYDTLEKDEPLVSNSEKQIDTLESLRTELYSLIEERNQIDQKIHRILSIIEEKEQEKPKERVYK